VLVVTHTSGAEVMARSTRARVHEPERLPGDEGMDRQRHDGPALGEQHLELVHYDLLVGAARGRMAGEQAQGHGKVVK
jgi:hypothetical protein